MKAKTAIIRQNLAGLKVLDIGGSGYGEDNPYERELTAAWQTCKQRVCVDVSEQSDYSFDLNKIPIPEISDTFDVASAFDVLEHLKNPVDVLRWIPCAKLVVILPNALSWITRKMEEKFRSEHIYSFTPYTAGVLLKHGGWRITAREYQFGKWNIAARCINIVGSLCPSRIATGLVFYCEKIIKK